MKSKTEQIEENLQPRVSLRKHFITINQRDKKKVLAMGNNQLWRTSRFQPTQFLKKLPFLWIFVRDIKRKLLEYPRGGRSVENLENVINTMEGRLGQGFTVEKNQINYLNLALGFSIYNQRLGWCCKYNIQKRRLEG